MKLYEFGPTRSLRVRWTLQELGVDFQSVTVNLLKGEHRSPQFLALKPGGEDSGAGRRGPRDHRVGGDRAVSR